MRQSFSLNFKKTFQLFNSELENPKLFLFESGLLKNGSQGDVIILRNGLYSENFYADIGCNYNFASKNCQYEFKSNYTYLWDKQASTKLKSKDLSEESKEDIKE